jgi:DNA polymerase elongation subunit (family B)
MNIMQNHNFIICNGDTDSIMICKQDMSSWSKEEQESLLEEINSLLPKEIRFANDGVFTKAVILKAKNYIMIDEKGKRKMKGSSLKSSTLEPALKDMLGEFIEAILADRLQDLMPIYERYINLALGITDISKWCTKKSLSPTTYNSERKNETDIIDAIKGSEYKSGDRVYLYAKSKVIELDEFYKTGPKKGQRKTKKVKVYGLQENFNGDYDKQCYVDKVLATTKRFSTVIDTSIFRKYTVVEES